MKLHPINATVRQIFVSTNINVVKIATYAVGGCNNNMHIMINALLLNAEKYL